MKDPIVLMKNHLKKIKQMKASVRLALPLLIRNQTQNVMTKAIHFPIVMDWPLILSLKHLTKFEMNFSASLLNRKYGFLHKNSLNDIKASSYLIGTIHYCVQHSCIHQELLMMNLSLVRLLNSNFQFSIKNQVNF